LSAAVNGKGGDLIRSLNDAVINNNNAQIPKDKWAPPLRSCSLCNAVANGKGDDLIRFVNGTGISSDQWPSLLGSESFCSPVVHGKRQ
jgi:hypothetical protein